MFILFWGIWASFWPTLPRGVSVVSAVSASSAASDAPPRSSSSVVLESTSSAVRMKNEAKPSVPQQNLSGKGCWMLDMPDEGWSSANVLNSKDGMFDRSVQAVSTHFQTLEQICIRHHPTFRALVQWEPYHAISSLDSRLWSVSGKWHSSSCPTSRGSVRKAWWPARSCSPVWPCNPRREIRMDHS